MAVSVLFYFTSRLLFVLLILLLMCCRVVFAIVVVVVAGVNVVAKTRACTLHALQSARALASNIPVTQTQPQGRTGAHKRTHTRTHTIKHTPLKFRRFAANHSANAPRSIQQVRRESFCEGLPRTTLQCSITEQYSEM